MQYVLLNFRYVLAVRLVRALIVVEIYFLSMSMSSKLIREICQRSSLFSFSFNFLKKQDGVFFMFLFVSLFLNYVYLATSRILSRIDLQNDLSLTNLLYSSIDRYEIHVKSAHINSRWIGTIAYRVTLNEMFNRRSLIHARMFRFCQK